jgi:hypothetical protein
MTSAEPLAAATLTIAEVAARTGLSADTLRYYEKANLISSVGRSAGGGRNLDETRAGVRVAIDAVPR